VSKRKPPPLKSEPAPPRLWLGLSAEERQLFEREFAGVAPLGGSERVPVAPNPSAPGRLSSAPSKGEGKALALRSDADTIEGASYGVSHETLHKLARGKVRIEKTCDLHGQAAQVARHTCERFVVESARSGLRAVLIICGRGLHSGDDGPVLRNVVVDVLRSARQHVLGFTSLPPERGGTGALAVLLRGTQFSKISTVKSRK
jgi:DNA-nicking Smr family endonuclease